jgi:hypothetical protein
MLGWSRKLWILISRVIWFTNRISPSNSLLGIFLRAQRKLVALCLSKKAVPAEIDCSELALLQVPDQLEIIDPDLPGFLLAD